MFSMDFEGPGCAASDTVGSSVGAGSRRRAACRLLCNGSVAALALIALTPAANAQSQPTTDTQPAADKAPAPQSEPAADTGQIGDIVVTARRREESAQKTPISITAVTGDDLKARSVASAADLQAIVPGLSMNQNASDSLSVAWQLRALTQTDENSVNDAPISIYSDGVLLNSLSGVLAASVVDLERVEVLKGPQGTLYGRNTTGGAVNTYTRQPVDRWEGEITAGAGSFGGYEGDAVINAPLGGGNAIRLVGQVAGSRGYGYNIFNNTRTGGKSQAMVRGTLKLLPVPGVTVTLRADYSTIENDGGGVLVPLYIQPGSLAARDIAAVRGTSQADAIAYYNQFVALGHNSFTGSYNDPNFASLEAYGASGTIEADLGFARLKSITAYRHTSNARGIDTDAMPINVFNFTLSTDIAQFTQELQLNGDTIGNRLHYTLGGYYFNFRGHDLNSSPAVPALSATQPTRTDGLVYTYSKALFGQFTFDILPVLHFTGGLRYTHESKKLISRNNNGPTFACNVPAPAGINGAPCVGTFRYAEGNWSYTAGLDWNVAPAILLYAKTSRGFKSGGINEKLTTNPGSAAPFLSEQLTDYEVGFKSDLFDHHLRFNIDYYHSVYKNGQRSAFILVPPFSAISVIRNAASATIDGVEAETIIAPTREFKLQGTLGYTLPKYISYIDNVTGADFSNLPFNQVSKWTYGVSGSYTKETDFGSAGLQLDWSYRSKRNLFPTGGTPALDNQPGFGLLNGQIQLTVAKAGIDARFFVKNILNKYYLENIFDVTPSIGVVTGYPGTPRTWGFSLTKKF